jgi:signal peptidase I
MNRRRIKAFLSRFWKDWRLTVFLVVFVILPVKSSLADFNWVPTGSMKPTILEGDFVFVNKAAYDLRVPLTRHRLARWADPKRGDIVICFSPDEGTRLIKRVVGLPGDVLEMRSNRLFINGQFAQQSQIDPQTREDWAAVAEGKRVFAMEQLDSVEHAIMGNPSVRALRNFGPVTVPADRYFMMGDNRDNSRDSRVFGFVDRSAIVGRAVGIAGSFNIIDKYQPRIGRFFQELH